MDTFEFELRYLAYCGLSTKFWLWWDREECLRLVAISSNGYPPTQIQNILPDELKQLTLLTYTNYKKNFIESADQELSPGKTLAVYLTRLEYELKVIKEMGFNTYFLIVQDFCNRSKKNDIIVWPGRGSGAGSLLAWVIGITDVDPLPYDLLFERFLNPARVSMPDFDIDFEDTQREKVLAYVRRTYGADKVCAIGTFMQMATKAAFKDAARAIGLGFDRSNYVTTLFPDGVPLATMMTHADTSDELKNIYDSDKMVQHAIDLWAELEGNMRQLGVHACGIVIAPEPITTYSAVQDIAGEPEMKVSQFEGKSIETLGLLKMDFLGLRNLTVIRNCIKIIKAKSIAEWKVLPKMFSDFFETSSFHPPLEDMETFEKVFQSWDTTGIFQFESDGMRRFLTQLKSTHINDLVAMVALYRPGPMEFIPSFIKRKHGEEPIEYMLPELKEALLQEYDEAVVDSDRQKLIEDLDPILGITYGIAVYQEQLMFLAQAMAGFSFPEADELRRAIGKKKEKDIAILKPKFINGAVEKRWYKQQTPTLIYEKLIEPAARYSFNKSHAVCYALIAYETGYLKAYYPVEFYAALLRSVEEDTDKLSFFITEVQQHGITVNPPAINRSFAHISAIGDTVDLGFLSIKGIGSEIAERIETNRREKGPYISLEDFLTRCDQVVNKKSLESLVKVGALDEFAERMTLRNNIPRMIDRSKSSQSASGGLFGDMMVKDSLVLKPFPTARSDMLTMEDSIYKSFVSLHPLDGLYNYAKKYTLLSQIQGEGEPMDVKLLVVVKAIQKARKAGYFVMVEDVSGTKEIFMKDILDIQKLDILIIFGQKTTRLRIFKAIRTSRDFLVESAKNINKYDPTMTMNVVRKLRLAKDFMPVIQDFGQVDTVADDPTDGPVLPSAFDHDVDTIQAQESEDAPKGRTFPLPDGMAQMQALMQAIKLHPGELQIQIGAQEYMVSEKGLEEIKGIFA